MTKLYLSLEIQYRNKSILLILQTCFCSVRLVWHHSMQAITETQIIITLSVFDVHSLQLFSVLHTFLYL